MKINKLAIENIGLLVGSHEFDLSSSTDKDISKPIVLIGGLNGSGKTTMFDAIKLCLYGRSMFNRITDEDYNQYLYDKIHYSKITGKLAEFASVSLQFDYSHFGVVSSYSITRRWEFNKNKIKESFSVYKDDEVLDSVQKKFWQDFIKELIPIGLSELFFFDGEKIQKIISGDNDSEFRNSIKSLLGIDLIERLITDLKIYQTRNLKRKITTKLNEELESFETKREKLDCNLQKINSQLASLENNVLNNENDIEKYRNKITAQGGSFLESKNDLKIEAGILEEKIIDIEENMRVIASDNLPIAILESLAMRLKSYLQSELISRESKITDKALQTKKTELLSKLKANLKQLDIKEDYQKKFNLFLENEIDIIFSPELKKQVKEIFFFSSKLSQQIIDVIDNATRSIPQQLYDMKSTYETSHRKLQQVRRSINQAPAEELMKPMFDKMNQLVSKQVGLQSQKSMLQEDKHQIEIQIALIDREINKLLDSQKQYKKNDTKLMLSEKTLNVLRKYKAELAIKKVNELERMFKMSFNLLHRKKIMIDKISIDPVTFEINLYDSSKKRIVKENLSSGEKEIYAIALISALAKVSGHNLPFIIDTPLGRLDSEHRLNLIKNFFPRASHQMIIFSTNTEVDKELFDSLQPYLARAYNVEYDHKKGLSTVEGGYFWK
jgi:DNA sulfur modification protein DndD